MDLMLNLNLPPASHTIDHGQKVLSIGSCFTEHIGNALKDLKFQVLQNPNGILFDPASVCHSLVSYMQGKQYGPDDLFYYNELWQSWNHHSRFSGMDQTAVLEKINASQTEASAFLVDADWLIITLGSSFSYRLTADAPHQQGVAPFSPPTGEGRGGAAVANCHRAPGQWFQKHLLQITETVELLDNTLHQLFYRNRKVRIIFTISPVRHIRDGVVENNRSKARLVEAVHHLVNKFDRLHYFPSYELVIDVLRDYRFYAEDMVHPNYLATDFVLEKFLQTFMSHETNELVGELQKLNIARKHKAQHPGTEAHQRFLKAYLEKCRTLQHRYPNVSFAEELRYFAGS
ncbi:GSCFA family protein [Cnuella takakiae]|uniref:GSCFA family protein n=1 Tax=Cnuella takakiae TaxID=1302690 RepID=A0A1M4VP77_9BACT|nr:GSCFA domain-containing protein [Cnuella takakiae]OLY92541.1 GSCFA domain-containing protein [Cnuella takakiae]SHE70647.1 GSCFA family protein [Cnuella takakiae]